MEDTRKFITINENDNSVIMIDYFPFDSGKTEEQLLKEGFLVNEIPELTEIEKGYTYTMKYNIESNEVYYDRKEVIPSSNTPNTLLSSRITLLENIF